MIKLEKLKEKDEAPEWLTQEGYETLQRGYLLPNETVNQAIKRICDSSASYLNKPEMSSLFQEAIKSNWLCPASPIWANNGAERGLNISCNSVEIPDSVLGIFQKNTELAMLTKHGAGVGIYMGNVRGRGANIKGNGRSDGIIPWIKVYETTINSVSQGCHDDQTEILTEKGWVSFENLPQYKNIKVAQINNDNELEFVLPTDYFKYYVDEQLYYFTNKTQSLNALVTGNHNMLIERKKRISNKRIAGKFISNDKELTNKLELIKAENIKLHNNNRMWVAAKSCIKGREMTAHDRLAIAYQADGSTNPSGNSNGSKNNEIIYNFHFTKERKINRLTEILNKVGYYYTKYYGKNNDETFAVRFPINSLPSKLLTDTFDLSKISYEFAKEFINEIALWDGSKRMKEDNTGIHYTSTIKENVDFVQCVAVLAGYMTSFDVSIRPGRQNLYKTYITLNRHTVGGQDVKIEKIPYKGYVYCVSVPSNKIVTRRGGRTLIAGNSTRRGAAACYLPIDHGDFSDFLQIRRATGDHNMRARNMNIAACISDQFMQDALSGNEHNRKLWAETLQERFMNGEPYLYFSDNVNRQKPESYVKNNLDIKTSNICTEIFQYTDSEHTFVCCLSSLNLDKYDEWKNYKFSNGMTLPELSTWFLEGVMSEYIAKAQNIPGFECAVRSAIKGRALGLGVLGWHSYLQRNMIDFESFDAFTLNAEIFRKIDKESLKASQDLAKEYGECEWTKGLGIRNTFRTAVAPTASNSIISGGVSAGIEPFSTNVVAIKSAKGTFIKYNRDLKKLLESKGIDNQDTWSQIINANGSVQGLKQLSDEEKAIWKTARQINQHSIVRQASQRQKFIDQGQSVNLFFTSDASAKYIHEVHWAAWETGNIKSLYYLRSETPLKGESSYKSPDECIACEG